MASLFHAWLDVGGNAGSTDCAEEAALSIISRFEALLVMEACSCGFEG
tara:strand:+ start:1583 stop:1726 length:144 start_codon:yes stop_codon:yes gene_type:complete